MPDYKTTQHAHAQKKAKCSGQAERSGEWGFGGLPRLRQNTSRPRAEESQVQPPSRALRRMGVRGVSPDYDTTQHAHAQKKAKRMRPDRAQRRRGAWGSPPATAIRIKFHPRRLIGTSEEPRESIGPIGTPNRPQMYLFCPRKALRCRI
jgi:hypothetical protein